MIFITGVFLSYLHNNMDEITVISDNNFFALGISDLLFQVKILTPCDITEWKDSHSRHEVIVMSVYDDKLRRKILSELVGVVDRIIIFDNILEAGRYFKFRNVIYASPWISINMLCKLIHVFDDLRPLHFTISENIFWNISFLSNETIATLMMISIKTCSGYRTAIKNKCCIERRNPLSMEKLRRDFSVIESVNLNSHNRKAKTPLNEKVIEKNVSIMSL
jgi:hypothetical protein